jgi:DNA repair protein RadC
LANELKAIIGEAAEHVADRLISRFGSVGRVMSASPEALAATLGENHSAINAITAANTLVRLGIHEQLVGRPINVTDPLLQEHLRAQLLYSGVERLYAVFVDPNGLYLNSEMISIGGRGNLIFDLRKLVHRALDNDATGLLLAHNHPSGNCRPSPKDIAETQRLAHILEALELWLIDHLIVCSSSVYSLGKARAL